jgi:hypothetical protein
MQLQENVSLNSLKMMKATAISNAYVANYVAALTLIRANDKEGMKLLDDKAHIKLDKFSPSMSRPNFWGFVVFNSDIKNIKKIISPSVADELAQDAGRIVKSRSLKLQAYTTMNENQINWTDASMSVKLLKVRFNVVHSKLDNIANGIYHWDSLDEMAKGDLLYNVFSYLQQADGESDLLPRLRVLTDKKYLTVNSIASTLGQRLNKVFRMFEEDGAPAEGGGEPPPTGGEEAPTGGNGTMAKDIAPLPFKFEKGKIIKRKKRNWKPKKWKDPFLSKKLGDY